MKSRSAVWLTNHNFSVWTVRIFTWTKRSRAIGSEDLTTTGRELREASRWPDGCVSLSISRHFHCKHQLGEPSVLHNRQCSWICWYLHPGWVHDNIHQQPCSVCALWLMENGRVSPGCVIGVEVAVALCHTWHRQLGSVGLWSPWGLLWARWSWTSYWVRQIGNKPLTGNILAVIPPSVLWNNTDINSMIQSRSHGSQALNSFGVLSPHE